MFRLLFVQLDGEGIVIQPSQPFGFGIIRPGFLLSLVIMLNLEPRKSIALYTVDFS